LLNQAVFLVGGLGTRLKDRTRATPKPLLEVGGRPFLEYLLDEAARHGFSEILLLAGHFGQQVQERYDGRDWRGARIKVLCEPEPLGTGGAIRNVVLQPVLIARSSTARPRHTTSRKSEAKLSGVAPRLRQQKTARQ